MRRGERIRRAIAGVRVGEVDRWPTGGRADIHVGDKRRSVGVDVVEYAAQAAVVEVARSAAQTGLARAKDVPCEADTRHEVAVDTRNAIGIEARVTGELKPGRRQRIDRGVRA